MRGNLGLACCCTVLVAACASTKSQKPEFTWYQEALSTGGLATHTGVAVVSGDIRKIENLGKPLSLSEAQLNDGVEALKNCAAEVEAGYPLASLGLNLRASMLLSCLNMHGWSIEYSELTF
jgi:hypothetical protein